MLSLVTSILDKKDFTQDNFQKVNTMFFDKYSKYLIGETDLSTAGISLDFINKLSYYSTMFQVLGMSLTDGMFEMILTELKNDLETLVDKEKDFGKNLEKADFMKENFFIKGTELIIFIKAELGYYFIYNNKELRVFNLTNLANGYHIFGDGRFCSGNTYASLREVAKDGDVFSLVMFLINILSNYDDKAHHLAKPADFTKWKKLDTSEKWTRGELEEVIKTIETKYKTIQNMEEECKVSKEGRAYIEEKIEAIQDSLYAKVK